MPRKAKRKHDFGFYIRLCCQLRGSEWDNFIKWWEHKAIEIQEEAKRRRMLGFSSSEDCYGGFYKKYWTQVYLKNKGRSGN